MSTQTDKTINTVLGHLIKYKSIYLPLFLIITLSLPFLFRILNHNYLLISTSSYHSLYSATQINLSNFWQNPYHLILHLFSYLPHFPYLAQIFTSLLGVLSLLLLNNITKRFNLSLKEEFFLLLFIILSPVFIFTFATLSHHSLFIFLLLAGFSALFSKNKFLKSLSYIPFFLIPFFDLFSSFLALLLLALYFYLKKDNYVKPLGIMIFLLTSLNLVLGKPFLLGPYLSQNILFDLFSDLGGIFGLSLFAFLLAIIGLTITWKKNKFYLTYFFLPFFIPLYIYQTSSLIYLNFILLIFATFGFVYLFNKEWKLQIIKNATIFLLILGIIFSALTCIDRLSTLSPTPELEETLLALKDQPILTPDKIFSTTENSYLIQYFSQKDPFLTFDDPLYDEKFYLSQEVLSSSYPSVSFPILERHHISHILITEQMQNTLPHDQGLLFIFKNERFKRIHLSEQNEIWEFN